MIIRKLLCAMRSVLFITLCLAALITCQDMEVRPRVPRPVKIPHSANWDRGVSTADWRKAMTDRRNSFGRNAVQRDERRPLRGGIVTADKPQLFTTTPHSLFDKSRYTVWMGLYPRPTTTTRLPKRITFG